MATSAPLSILPRFSSSKAWLRALELTAPIVKNPLRIFPNVIEEQAMETPDAPALLSASECLSYRELSRRANQYTRWALGQGLGKGDTVGLIMPNRPEYLAIWLGISRTGCAVALLNTHLTGPSLAHCLNIVAPKHVIAAAALIERMPDLTTAPTIWVHGPGHGGLVRHRRGN